MKMKMSGPRWRLVGTPDGLFIHDRGTGLCIFNPAVKTSRWTKPLYAQVAVTERCNLHCWWCYASSSPCGGAEWSAEGLKRLARFLDSWGLLGVAYGGGEPFVHPSIVEVIRYTWENTGLDVSVTTNGYAPTEEQLRGIEGRASEVRVSIRHPEDCANLRKFIGRGFELGVNLLLMRGNAPLIGELMDRCAEMGIEDFLINSFLATGGGAQYRLMEPTEEDMTALCEVVDRHGEATIRVSSRLAAMMRESGGAQRRHKFIPFSDERRGRIVAITADRKVKPSSLSREAYPFDRLEDIPEIYARMANGGEAQIRTEARSPLEVGEVS